MVNNSADIVKVRLQTTTQYKSALECATQIFKKEGPTAFYKGTLTPLIGIGACVSCSPRPRSTIDKSSNQFRCLSNSVPTMRHVAAWKS